MTATMLWQLVEPLQMMVLVHGEVSPTDCEWDEYFEKLYGEYRRGNIARVLVFCDGPGPTLAQRKKLNHMVKRGDQPICTAVVTHGIVARGIVTALNLFYEIRAFSPTEIDDAFRYLGVPDIEWYMLRRTVATIRVKLSMPMSSATMTDTIGKLDELVTDRLPRLRERLKVVRK